MAAEVTIALVFTPDAWVEQLHRHCTDHGGARVRQVLIDPALALEDTYDVLVVSHRWPSLTMGLVADLHHRGRLVLGVYEREEPMGGDLLRSVGADAVVASDAGAAGIVAALRSLQGDATHDGGGVRAADVLPATRRAPVTVVTGTAGAGATEIAIGLTLAAGDGSVLVDANDVAPAVAARLALPVEPNLRTAIEAIEFDGDDVFGHLAAVPGNGGRALAGLPSAAGWAQLRPPEVLRTVEVLAGPAALVVVDVASELENLPVAMARPRHAIARACVIEAEEVVVVGHASPPGVARLLARMGDVRALAPRTPLHAVVNRAPRDAFRRGELTAEIGAAYGVTSVTMVPSDRRVETAAWAGTPVGRGRFTRAMSRLAAQLVAVPVEVAALPALQAAS